MCNKPHRNTFTNKRRVYIHRLPPIQSTLSVVEINRIASFMTNQEINYVLGCEVLLCERAITSLLIVYDMNTEILFV